ncbi:MAG: OmpA family protein [Spirochaetaceae bacterium]|jgi:outer membrane protein OmpA-like peptidoglycan-associated protein|nr:OmpA family protein [Spirochaetaceae bacterium]
MASITITITLVSNLIKRRNLLRQLLFMLAFLAAGAVSAQESKFSFGLSGEISGGADPKMYEGGGGWTGSVEYRFKGPFSGGGKIGVSNDFQYRIAVFKQSMFARWYFWRFNSSIEAFAELGPGALLMMRGNEIWASLEIALSAGARFSFGNNWYVEPYLGTGYPVWGRLGVAVGYRVPLQRPGSFRAPAAGPANTEAEALTAAEKLAQENPPPAGDGQGAAGPSGGGSAGPAYVIIFPPNRMDFNGLDSGAADENSRTFLEIENVLSEHPEYRVLLDGYANPVEGTEVEDRNELRPLSRQRAEKVAETLVNAGIDRRRLIIAGSGGLRSDRDNRQKNRRVELTIIK